ncbi:hypothetical protein E2C01_033431 [Portunus trituberculatus]|uniref:Uncharacterized protein n=1 Tax=Portunus trituberculatus TaxID=210409 RepID=A0A5B7F3Q3_PORTR|nr:hypothetical protein [Portunus trituberculatus]
MGQSKVTVCCCRRRWAGQALSGVGELVGRSPPAGGSTTGGQGGGGGSSATPTTPGGSCCRGLCWVIAAAATTAATPGSGSWGWRGHGRRWGPAHCSGALNEGLMRRCSGRDMSVIALVEPVCGRPGPRRATPAATTPCHRSTAAAAAA